MYFRLIAGVKPQGELTHQEQTRVDNIVEDLVGEFLEKKHRFDYNYDQLIKTTTEDDGFLYLANTQIGNKQCMFEYFVSSFEFGPPRKDLNDKRFNIQWKEFILDYIRKFSPEFAEQYLHEWAYRYKTYRKRIRQQVPKTELEAFDESTENACEIGRYTEETIGIN